MTSEQGAVAMMSESADGSTTHQPRKGKGGKPQKPRGPKTEPGPIAPPMVKATEGPKPTAPATKATKPRNEPMFSDIDMMGFPGVAPYRRNNDFAITTEGFIPLVEKEHDVIASVQPFFSKTVSKSAFVYYCTQHLCARLVSIKRERYIIMQRIRL